MQRILLVIDVSVQPAHIFKGHFTHNEGAKKLCWNVGYEIPNNAA